MATNENIKVQATKYLEKQLTRHDFPSTFLWGVATSCYQIEGAYADGGKSLNTWDVFSMQSPAKIHGGTNGCIAIDHYYRMQEDVKLMKKLGIDTYRFSISWSRILPAGRLSGGINKEGVKFYNDLIDTLKANDIKPCVTIFHWDYPQCLEDEYQGFLSERIVKDFAEYAEVCFFEFGDRVQLWITQNEPWTFTHHGYVAGSFPPAHGSESIVSKSKDEGACCCRAAKGVDKTLRGGHAGTEPYIVAHNLLIAHATAVDIYRKKYQAVQGGLIGVTNVSMWFDPYSSSQEDVDAASRAVDFMWGWFVEPIVTGDYPRVMRQFVGDRLPTFTAEQKKLLEGSFDFIGMNYYTARWVQNNPTPPGTTPTYYTDQQLTQLTDRNGQPIGFHPEGSSDWMYFVPHGIYRLLVHTKDTYGDPIIYITENGTCEGNDPSLTITQGLKDPNRITYYREHFAYMMLAMDQDVRLKAYYAWSLIDNYEWAEGYSVRFGFFFVDFVNNLNRYPKDSAIWFMNFLNKHPRPGPKREAPKAVEEVEDIVGSRRKRAR